MVFQPGPKLRQLVDEHLPGGPCFRLHAHMKLPALPLHFELHAAEFGWAEPELQRHPAMPGHHHGTLHSLDDALLLCRRKPFG